MKNFHRWLLLSFWGGVALLWLGGCASSQPSKFYTLNAMKTAPEAIKEALTGPPNSSILLDVEIPDYLDRPQIVTRSGLNELNFAEYERWAGSLREDLARVIAENLSFLLSAERVSVITERRGTPNDFRVVVEVLRFEVMPEGHVLLKAQWSVTGKGGAASLPVRESKFSQAVAGKGYQEKVAAMSRTVEMLSRDIAAAIKPLIPGAKK